MAFCPSCGGELKDGAEFCGSCGCRLKWGTQQPADSAPGASIGSAQAANDFAANAAAAAAGAAAGAASLAGSFANKAQAAARNVQASASQGSTQLETGFMRIHDKVITWGGNVVAVNHVEHVRIDRFLPSFPLLSLLLVVVGLICGFFMPPLGVVLLLACLMWIGYWWYRRKTAPYFIFIKLNSGREVSLSISDVGFASKIMSAIEEAMCQKAVSVEFALPANIETKIQSGKKSLL